MQVTEATPDSVSDAVPVRVIPETVNAAPSTGEVTARAGLVLSRLIVALVVAVFPAVSAAVPVTIWPVPSRETVCGAVQLASARLPGVQVNVTVTFQLFQPLAFAA